MRLLRSAAGVAALLGIVSAQDADSKTVVDAETGFTFGEFVTDQHIAFRIAIPNPAPASGSYDAVVQIAAPIAVGWAALAWGGSMTYNPLTIAWKNGNDVVISSRFAFGYYVPPAYDKATYTVLKTGTHVNATHWQITAQCKGCTKWGDDDTGVTALDPTQQNALAFALSSVAPDTPASNTSSFGIHENIGHWYHDLTQGENAGFDTLVSKNSEGPGSSSTSTTATASGGSTGTPTSTTILTPPKTTSSSSTSTVASSTSPSSSSSSVKPTVKPTKPPMTSRPHSHSSFSRPTPTVKPSTHPPSA